MAALTREEKLLIDDIMNPLRHFRGEICSDPAIDALLVAYEGVLTTRLASKSPFSTTAATIEVVNVLGMMVQIHVASSP